MPTSLFKLDHVNLSIHVFLFKVEYSIISLPPCRPCSKVRDAIIFASLERSNASKNIIPLLHLRNTSWSQTWEEVPYLLGERKVEEKMANSFYLQFSTLHCDKIPEMLGEEMPLLLRFIHYSSYMNGGQPAKHLSLVKAWTLPSQWSMIMNRSGSQNIPERSGRKSPRRVCLPNLFKLRKFLQLNT